MFLLEAGKQCGAFELIRESLSSSQKQLAPEVRYVEYISSEESAYEDEEDPITGEVTQKLKGYLTKKLSWERTALTNFKASLTEPIKEASPLKPKHWQSPGLRVMYQRGQHPMVHHGP